MHSIALRLTAATLIAGASLTAAASSVPPGSVLGTWVYASAVGSTKFDVVSAVAIAQANDLVIALPAQFSDEILVPMRLVNPDLKVLAYINGTFFQYASSYKPGEEPPEAAFEHDVATGRRIQQLKTGTGGEPRFNGDYLMNPDSPDWQRRLDDTCANAIAKNGYDGCYVDNLGTGIIEATYINGKPLNPATGRRWTETEWMTASATLGQVIEAHPGQTAFAVNGIGAGVRYYDSNAPTSLLVVNGELGVAEGFIRYAKSPLDAVVNIGQWTKNVDMIADAESRGAGILALAKTFTTCFLRGGKSGCFATGATGETLDEARTRWHKFALSSFLLGTSGGSRFDWQSAQTVEDVTAFDAYAHVDIGQPLDHTYKANADGTFSRAFGKGLVIVNPRKDPVTVALSKRMFTLDGERVRSIRLGANSGEVLTLHR